MAPALETSALSPGASVRDVAPSKRGLQRGLQGRLRTLVLMWDETIVTETPPLYARYGPVGAQAEVPISGSRAKRIWHGAIHIGSGDVALLVTAEWDAETHQAFLRQIRSALARLAHCAVGRPWSGAYGGREPGTGS